MRSPQPSRSVKPLTPRQANALQMLLDGCTKGTICEQLGITQKTLWNWRKLPAWNETVDVVLKEASGDGQGQIKSMLPMATRRLQALITDYPIAALTRTRIFGKSVAKEFFDDVAREETAEIPETEESTIFFLLDRGNEQYSIGHSSRVVRIEKIEKIEREEKSKIRH